jgi:hypothetical protein
MLFGEFVQQLFRGSTQSQTSSIQCSVRWIIMYDSPRYILLRRITKQTIVTKESKHRVTGLHATNYNAHRSLQSYSFPRLLAITDVVIRARIDLTLFNGGHVAAGASNGNIRHENSLATHCFLCVDDITILMNWCIAYCNVLFQCGVSRELQHRGQFV